MPGYGGTSTSGISSESATSAACSGPAPPKATSANSRGSCPFSIVRERIARAMFEFAIVRIPSAVSASPSPSSAASPWTASTAASRSSFMRPPRNRSGSSLPSTVWASLMVGSVPPSP